MRTYKLYDKIDYKKHLCHDYYLKLNNIESSLVIQEYYKFLINKNESI